VPKGTFLFVLSIIFYQSCVPKGTLFFDFSILSINILCLKARCQLAINFLIKEQIQISHPVRDEKFIEKQSSSKWDVPLGTKSFVRNLSFARHFQCCVPKGTLSTRNEFFDQRTNPGFSSR
jgi:hypothetical protein